MWDCVTAVDENHGPILYEGTESCAVVIINAGPASVEIGAWDVTNPAKGEVGSVKLQLRPGNMRIVSGALVRAALTDEIPTASGRFAALGWRVDR
jgi:hypothetical protein